MDTYTEIRNKIRAMTGQKTSVVNGESSKLLITPKQGSYVTLLDLSGELRETEVIGYSQIEAIDIDTSGSIKINCHGDTDIDCDGTITLNGGRNDGLVNINQLKENLDKLRQYVLVLKTAVSESYIYLGVNQYVNPAGAKTSFEAYFTGTMATKTIRFDDMEDPKVKH